MTGHAVVIAGGGPTGLMLAGELALAGIDVAIVERRPSQDLPGQRAGGLHARTIEVLDQRGIADRFLKEGQTGPGTSFGWIPVSLSGLPTRHPYVLALWQNHIERILAGWVGELNVPVYRGLEVTGFAQDDTGVDVELSDGRRLRTRYLVGCDGGRSLIRKAAGIGFPGWDAETRLLIAEAEMDSEPEMGLHRDEKGLHGLSRTEDGTRVRVMVPDPRPVADKRESGEPTLRDLSEAITAVYGTDFGLRGTTSIARFSDAARQAESYRDRRVLLAGDAAHVHYPMGGQGLGTGVQDAVNLGWKLAQVVGGTSPDALLDSYHAERHPVAARVLRNTMAQAALTRVDARTDALRAITAELLSMDEPRTRIAALMSGLDIHYDLGSYGDPGPHDNPGTGHPLVGRRMPDLDLVTADGSLRAFTLLHDARPVLLNLGGLGGPGDLDITPWADRVRLANAGYAGRWELPVLGEVAAPAAVLLRPDGYGAWAGGPPYPGLDDALTTWFGSPRPTKATARLSKFSS